MEYTLKYLFVAQFADGERYEQNNEDTSLVDPKKSSFFDVLQKIESGKQLVAFFLVSETEIWGLDMSDGHFEVNQIPFKVFDRKLGEPELTGRRLIYFRRVNRNINQISGEELSVEVTYMLGWQANDDKGVNHQRVVELF